ncbi:hypothetical protein CRG98_006662 [Punica granatum]|uniref:Uncharacterized protein n=1 Tax=Punica granatum TaxID=22663 RepID=A0A2I0KWW3_PUNGR|nr:hypothetical protein CRG98_006662 [Punica granatum]
MSSVLRYSPKIAEPPTVLTGLVRGASVLEVRRISWRLDFLGDEQVGPNSSKETPRKPALKLVVRGPRRLVSY